MNEGQVAFELLATDMLTRPGCTRSTMMGFPCLRRDGQFFVSVHRTGESLIVKTNRERVAELIDAGTGEAFAPNGRTFREWVAIPVAQKHTWPERADEAWEFAGGS